MVRTQMTPPGIPGWNWGTKTYYSFIRGYDSAGAKQSASGIIEFSSVGSGHELVQNSNEDYTNLSGLLGLSSPPQHGRWGFLMWMETECPIDGKRLFNLI